MKSPIEKIREEHDLSRSELAQLVGVRYDVIHAAENAVNPRLHRKLLTALVNLGYERTEIESKHASFVGELQRRALEKVEERHPHEKGEDSKGVRIS